MFDKVLIHPRLPDAFQIPQTRKREKGHHVGNNMAYRNRTYHNGITRLGPLSGCIHISFDSLAIDNEAAPTLCLCVSL